MRTRPVHPGDEAAIEATVAEGFATYRAFAPAGWEWPPFEASDLLAAAVAEMAAQGYGEMRRPLEEAP